jgi:hypothetical protein
MTAIDACAGCGREFEFTRGRVALLVLGEREEPICGDCAKIARDVARERREALAAFDAEFPVKG